MQASVIDSADQTQPNPTYEIMSKLDPNPTHGQLWARFETPGDTIFKCLGLENFQVFAWLGLENSSLDYITEKHYAVWLWCFLT
jgi:succinate dehydrogenase hydrophobic anchor subunit